MQEKDQGLIKNKTEAILKELQTVISVFYILMVGIGMLFEYQRYSLFGINIFDYANVFDFLIAPFKSPLIFMFILVSLLVSYLAFKSDLFLKRKWPKFYRISSFGLGEKSWYDAFRVTAVTLIFISYIFASSQILAANNKEQFHKNTRKISVTFSNNDKIEGYPIGSTNEVLFLSVENSVKIIPMSSSVMEIDLNFNPSSKKGG